MEPEREISDSDGPVTGRAWMRDFGRGFVVLCLVLAGWFWWQGAERRALLDRPPTDRAQVYKRDLANFRTLCTNDPPMALTERCRDLARRLSWLPECDAACAEVISPALPGGFKAPSIPERPR